MMGYSTHKRRDRGEDGTEDPMLVYSANDGNKQVAYLTALPQSSEGDGPFIKGVYVSPEHRRRGLSKKLFSLIEEDHKGQTLRLRARPYKDKSTSKEDLMKIYESFGYSPYDEDGRMKKQGSSRQERYMSVYQGVLYGQKTTEMEKEATLFHTLNAIRNIGLKNTGKLTAMQAAPHVVKTHQKATSLAHNKKLHDFIGLDNIPANLPYWGMGTVAAPSSLVTMPMTAASMIVPPVAKKVMDAAAKSKGVLKGAA